MCNGLAIFPITQRLQWIRSWENLYACTWLSLCVRASDCCVWVCVYACMCVYVRVDHHCTTQNVCDAFLRAEAEIVTSFARISDYPPRCVHPQSMPVIIPSYSHWPVAPSGWHAKESRYVHPHVSAGLKIRVRAVKEQWTRTLLRFCQKTRTPPHTHTRIQTSSNLIIIHTPRARPAREKNGRCPRAFWTLQFGSLNACRHLIINDVYTLKDSSSHHRRRNWHFGN